LVRQGIVKEIFFSSGRNEEASCGRVFILVAINEGSAGFNILYKPGKGIHIVFEPGKHIHVVPGNSGNQGNMRMIMKEFRPVVKRGNSDIHLLP
jgi:ribosomal protein L2